MVVLDINNFKYDIKNLVFLILINSFKFIKGKIEI